MQNVTELVCGIGILVVALFAPGVASAQPADIGSRLMADPKIAAVVRQLQEDEPALLEEQVRICEVPAPPFEERARAELYKRLFEEAGLENVRIDREGNVLGERRGRKPRPHVVFSAHLDTVFPEGTDVRVTRSGSELKGPGIGDDCRGLAVVLAVARAIVRNGIETEGTITFVGTVGEEGLGDLRGVKHLFHTELAGRVDCFVSVDGAGLGITHAGVGSRRYRVTFRGPGGHSYGAFGMANPIHALGRAVAAISEFQVPADPRTTFNVGRIGGGTSVNSIPFESWMEVDMRSVDAGALADLDRRFHEAIDRAVAAENARWAAPGEVTAEKTLVGDRPAGATPANSSIVAAALSASRVLGIAARLNGGSTDANIPMAMGIPAITIDGGGSGSSSHSLDETFDSRNSWKGTQRAFLLAIALTFD